MKKRMDFVTNSSSSSFIISKKFLDEDQIEAIRRHSTLGKKLGLSCADEPWDITENDDYITGDTYLDNFDFGEFLDIIEVKSKCINWGKDPFVLDCVTVDTLEKHDSTDWRHLLHEG